MSREQVVQLVDIFKKETGVYPVIYGGYWLLSALTNDKDKGNLSKCSLWQDFFFSAFGYSSDIQNT